MCIRDRRYYASAAWAWGPAVFTADFSITVNMWAEQSYFAMFFATALCGVWAASTGLKTCDHYYYYDHGTDDCEPCGDICDEANHTNTVPQCWELCRGKL